MSKLQKFERDLAQAINKHSYDNYCGIPDFVLAQFITKCLYAMKDANSQADMLGLNVKSGLDELTQLGQEMGDYDG